MNIRLKGIALASSAVLLGCAQLASADYYVAGSYGLNDQDDSYNSGLFTTAFTTGQVTGVNPPLNLPSASAVGWNTEFDSGDIYTLAFGRDLGQFRLELEYSGTDADVETHRGVSAGGIDLSGIDAGVLIAGNTSDLGVSVAGLVADGRGQIENSTLLFNAYYDFDMGGALTPFVGVGLGQSQVDVTYNPSGVSVINDDDNVYTYQIAGGLSFNVNDNLSIVGTARYRDSGDVTVGSTLLPAQFDIENTSYLFDVGVRYTF